MRPTDMRGLATAAVWSTLWTFLSVMPQTEALLLQIGDRPPISHEKLLSSAAAGGFLEDLTRTIRG